MKKRIACILVIALMILAGYVGLQLRNREDARQFDLNSMTLREAYETASDCSGALGGFADANHMGFEATVEKGNINVSEVSYCSFFCLVPTELYCAQRITLQPERLTLENKIGEAKTIQEWFGGEVIQDAGSAANRDRLIAYFGATGEISIAEWLKSIINADADGNYAITLSVDPHGEITINANCV